MAVSCVKFLYEMSDLCTLHCMMMSFYIVQIPKGGKQNTDWLIKQLKSSISEPFQATQVNLVFYLAVESDSVC